MRYPPHLLDEIRARLSVSQVVARKVALKRAGREFRALSPFKVEKTPSFFVNDQKGFYHCFASGEHGDIFRFLMKTEGLSFPEAVERLAAEAGVPLPKPSAGEEQQADARGRLLELHERAAQFFEAALRSAGGREARQYLERRGLGQQTLIRFRLGFAPNARSALKEHLAAAGYTHDEMVRSGLLVAGDEIPVSYDRFRNRVIFPITDGKGRIIAFGGRALDPDQPAKYLNSPETPIFHKGSILFNAASARAPAHDRTRVIAVEGYMDVIALVEAGFDETVAPMGTALTEGQLAQLWRLAPEPILCFDGDSAGRRAAFRAVETVLPHLKPGFSVSFVFLPDGLDPDDVVRQQGAGAFGELLQRRKRALFDVLMEREQGAGPSAPTPEVRAALESRLRGLVAKIGDRTVRTHYEQELKATLWARSRNEIRVLTGIDGARGRRATPERRKNAEPDWRTRERARLGRSYQTAEPRPAAASNELARHTEALPAREALLVGTLLNHPWLIGHHAEDVANLTLTSGPLAMLRNELLGLASDENSLDRASLRSQLERLSMPAGQKSGGVRKVVDLVERAIANRRDRFAQPDADVAEVETGWRHTLALHERQIGLRRALEAAERAWNEEGSEDALARICEIQRLLANLNSLEFPAEA